MDAEQIMDTVATERCEMKEEFADSANNSELAEDAEVDASPGEHSDEDVTKGATDAHSIPVASPMRCRPAKRGLGALYSTMVLPGSAAERQHLSPTRGVRNLASLLRANTMPESDIAQLQSLAGPEPPELARARERAARGRTALAKASETRRLEQPAAVPQEATRSSASTEAVVEPEVEDVAEPVAEPRQEPAAVVEDVAEAEPSPPVKEQKAAPKKRGRGKAAAAAEVEAPSQEDQAVLEEKPVQAEPSEEKKVAEVAADAEEAEASEHTVALPLKEDTKSPKAKGGKAKEAAKAKAKSKSAAKSKSSAKEEFETAPAEEDQEAAAPEEEQVAPPAKKSKKDQKPPAAVEPEPSAPPAKRSKKEAEAKETSPPAEEEAAPPAKPAKKDPEVEHFLSLSEKQREKHMMSLSFTKQSKLAMKISLAEGL